MASSLLTPDPDTFSIPILVSLLFAVIVIFWEGFPLDSVAVGICLFSHNSISEVWLGMLVFQFMQKVFSGEEVRALCRSSEFFLKST